MQYEKWKFILIYLFVYLLHFNFSFIIILWGQPMYGNYAFYRSFIFVKKKLEINHYYYRSKFHFTFSFNLCYTYQLDYIIKNCYSANYKSIPSLNPDYY